jgi:transcriptional regulator with XRE-family HTH domain
METIGDRIRVWRMKQGLSQAALGTLLGISQSHVSKIEHTGDTSCPMPPMLRALSTLTGMSLDELIGK